MVRHFDSGKTRRAPGKQHVERNEGTLVTLKCRAQAGLERPVSADLARHFDAHDASKSRFGEPRRQPTPESVELFFRCAIYDIESLFQLGNKLRHVLRRML